VVGLVDVGRITGTLSVGMGLLLTPMRIVVVPHHVSVAVYLLRLVQLLLLLGFQLFDMCLIVHLMVDSVLLFAVFFIAHNVEVSSFVFEIDFHLRNIFTFFIVLDWVRTLLVASLTTSVMQIGSVVPFVFAAVDYSGALNHLCFV
jgi:hypothetical protein